MNKYLTDYKSSSPFLSTIENENQFLQMRYEILKQPTTRQSQVALRQALANIDNEQENNEVTPNTESTTKKRESNASYGAKLFVHYTHEQRFHSCKRDMHKVYENIFKDTPAMYTELVVGNRNRRQATNELIRKRPSKALLKNEIVKAQSRT